MNPALWLAAVAASAAITGVVVYVVMRSRAEVVLARQREELAEARAALAVQKQALEESLRNAEESARSKAMNEFLADIRVEERSYVREHKMFFLHRRSLVRQERIFFRQIPLSNWVEQEVPLEEGADVEKLARTMAVFAGELDALALDSPAVPVRKLLRQ